MYVHLIHFQGLHIPHPFVFIVIISLVCASVRGPGVPTLYSHVLGGTVPEQGFLMYCPGSKAAGNTSV